MKFNWTKQEIIDNLGCYTIDQVETLSFINNENITLPDVMNSEISIRDKRWFLYNKGELTLKQKSTLAFLMAKDVAEIYNNKYPNDARVNDCLKAIDDFENGLIDRDTLMNKRRNAAAAAAAAVAGDVAAYDNAAAAAAYSSADVAYVTGYYRIGNSGAASTDKELQIAVSDAAAAAVYAAAAASYNERLTQTIIKFINENN